MTVLTAVAAATPQRPPSRPSRLLVAGPLAGPLFTATHLLAPALRHDDYSAARDPVSALALGPPGRLQIAGFVVCGLLVLLFAVGLRRSLRPGPGARSPGTAACTTWPSRCPASPLRPRRCRSPRWPPPRRRSGRQQR